MEGKLAPLDKAHLLPVGELYQNGPASKSKGSHEAGLWETSKGFEAMFMTQMYKAMRKTIHESELTKPSNGRKIFTELLDAEYAKMASGKSSSSLAGMVYRYLLENHEGPVPRVPQFGMVSGSAVPTSPYAEYQQSHRSIDEHKLEPIISEASLRYGIEGNLIKSVIQQESAYQPHAKSHAGAKGLMQLMDSTAREMGVTNVYDPRDNIMGGVRYLRYLYDRYDGNEKLALAAYNAGPAKVDKYGGIPPYPETQKYVNRVLAIKGKLDFSLKGEDHDNSNHE